MVENSPVRVVAVTTFFHSLLPLRALTASEALTLSVPFEISAVPLTSS